MPRSSIWHVEKSWSQFSPSITLILKLTASKESADSASSLTARNTGSQLSVMRVGRSILHEILREAQKGFHVREVRGHAQRDAHGARPLVMDAVAEILVAGRLILRP